MISNNRKKDFPVPKKLENAAAAAEQIALHADKEAISPAVYKGEKTVNGQKISTVRDTLKKIYHNKCAYCESIDHKPEVEHYRPKKSVTEDKTHNGYYWLCYEWSNLIPSCHYCNTDGGKGNQFPITGKRVYQPFFENGKLDKTACDAQNSPLVDELPLLFHPEIDEPEKAFAFKVNGKIEGIDDLGRGKKTVEICNLNRENLKYRRQLIIDGYKEEIQKIVRDYCDGEINENKLRKDLLFAFLKIKINAQPNKEFSLVSKYISEHFEQILIPLMEFPKQKLILKKAYQQFLTGKLIEV